MSRKGRSLTDAQKANLSKRAIANWNFCREMSKILNIPSQEVMANYALVKEYEGKLRSKNNNLAMFDVVRKGYFPSTNQVFEKVNKHLKEGKYKKVLSKVLDTQERRRKGVTRDPVSHPPITFTVGNPNQNIEFDRDNNNNNNNNNGVATQLENLNKMFWFIRQCGSIEKAEKVFNAAKAAFEAMK
jgi:hypothetical protein